MPRDGSIDESDGAGGAAAANDLRGFLSGERFSTVVADPPWRFIMVVAGMTGKRPMCVDHVGGGA